MAGNDSPAGRLQKSMTLRFGDVVRQNLADFFAAAGKRCGYKSDSHSSLRACGQWPAGSDAEKPVPDRLNQSGRRVLDGKNSLRGASAIHRIERILEFFAIQKRDILAQ